MITRHSGFAALALLVMAAACAAPGADDATQTGSTPATAEAKRAPGTVPGPPPAAVQIGSEASGTEILLEPRQPLVVRLLGTPTAGYLWRVVQLPDTLQTPENSFEAELPQEPGGPVRVGGNSFEIYTFAPGAAGTGELVMHYGRPWELERGARPERVFRVTVSVPAE